MGQRKTDRASDGKAAGGDGRIEIVNVGGTQVQGASQPGRKRREPRAEVRRRGFTDLETCLSVLGWFLDVIDNVNFHDALLCFHSQTQLVEYLKHRGPVGDSG